MFYKNKINKTETAVCHFIIEGYFYFNYTNWSTVKSQMIQLCIIGIRKDKNTKFDLFEESPTSVM